MFATTEHLRQRPRGEFGLCGLVWTLRWHFHGERSRGRSQGRRGSSWRSVIYKIQIKNIYLEMRNVLISTLNCSATKTVMTVCLMIFLMPLEWPACCSTLVTPHLNSQMGHTEIFLSKCESIKIKSIHKLPRSKYYWIMIDVVIL